MTSITNNPAAPPPLFSPASDNRLSLGFPTRLVTALGVSSLTGLFLGVSHGSQTAALRFRAENAHRLPTSSTGWYLYHKSKNYHVLYGGVGEGLKMGFKVGAWVGMFFTVEEAVDRLRGGRKDVASTVVGGLGVAGAWSIWSGSSFLFTCYTLTKGAT
ncbi:MAG: hypothetical protein M1836_006764 [Candelina mexicana]|nr:MAG: hypothetical protein M1836_006764 [Candelina mexicana]